MAQPTHGISEKQISQSLLDLIESGKPTDYATIVYFNSTNPTTATIFDNVNPPVTNDPLLEDNVANLYIGTDNSTWVYNGTNYSTKVVPASSNFYINGTNTDAGNNKTSAISRTNSIIVDAGGYDFGVYARGAQAGIYGFCDSSGDAGVHGDGVDTGGVWGTSDNNFGVLGNSISGIGVQGYSNSSVAGEFGIGALNTGKIATFKKGNTEVASIDALGNFEGNSFNGFQGFSTLASDLLSKLPKGTYTGTASDLEASILAISTGVQGVAITPTSTPTGTGVASWLIAESGTYTNFGGVILPVNHIGFIIRSASNVYSITSTELDLSGYVSYADIQDTTKSIGVEIVNNLDLSLGNRVIFPVSNWCFIPKQGILKDGYIYSFTADLFNNQVGRTVRFQILRPTVANTFELIYQTANLPAEVNGMFTLELNTIVKVKAGDKIGAVVITPNTANSIAFEDTGGPSYTSYGGWSISTAPTIIGSTYLFVIQYDSRGFGISAVFREEAIVMSSKINQANGILGLDANVNIPNSISFQYDYLAGKKMVWVGTSIPAGGGNLNYPKIVGQMLNCIVDNQAVGSSGIVWDGTRGLTLSATISELTSTFSGAFAPQSYENKIIGKQADYLVFDHGYNDTNKMTGINLGTINSTDKSTFYGAFNFVIQAALADRPTLKLIFITPPNRYEGAGNVNASKSIATIDLLRSLIFDLAKKYNALVVDLAILCNINNINYTQYKTDTIHPFDNDRERLAYIIARNIKNIG